MHDVHRRVGLFVEPGILLYTSDLLQEGYIRVPLLRTLYTAVGFASTALEEESVQYSGGKYCPVFQNTVCHKGL